MLRRLFAGLGISGGIILVTLFAQILSVPIFLARWGPTVYGEWLTLTGLASNVSIMNLGIQSYVCNLLISAYVRDEMGEGTRLLQSALYLYILLSGIAMAIVAAFAFSPGLLVWMKIEQTPNLHGRVVLVVYGLMSTYAIAGGLLLSLFQVTKQMPRQLAYGFVERLVMLYAPMLIAAVGGLPLAAAVATGGLMVILIVVELRDVWKRSPFNIGFSLADWSLSRSFIKPGLTFFAVSLTALMLSTGITVLLANQAGGQAVALFLTTMLLGNFVRVLVNQGMNVLWPEITGVAALQDASARLSRWYFLLLKLVSAFAWISALGICAVGEDVLIFWTRGRIQIDPILNLLLALYMAIQAFGIVASAFGLALNRQADLLKTQLTAGGITLGLGAVLIRTYGVNGAAIALIIGQASIVLWMLKLACGWVDVPWRGFVRSVLPRLLFGFSLVAIASMFFAISSIGFIERFVSASALIVGMIFLFWKYWLVQDERNLLHASAVTLAQTRLNRYKFRSVTERSDLK